MIKKILKGKLTLLIFILVILVVTLVGGLYIGYTQGYFDRFLPISYVDFKVSSGKTNLTFSIDKKDEENYKAFLNNLGVSETPSLSFQLDDKTTQFLSGLAPQRFNITFINDKDMKFNSVQLPALPSALSGKSIDFATKSATLNIHYQDEKDFTFAAKDPGVLLEEATKSSKVYVSKEIQELFPIASKVATMKVSVDSGSVSGEILLK